MSTRTDHDGQTCLEDVKNTNSKDVNLNSKLSAIYYSPCTNVHFLDDRNNTIVCNFQINRNASHGASTIIFTPYISQLLENKDNLNKDNKLQLNFRLTKSQCNHSSYINGYAFALGIIGIKKSTIEKLSNNDKIECLNGIRKNFSRIYEFDGGYNGRDDCSLSTIGDIGSKMNWGILSNCQTYYLTFWRRSLLGKYGCSFGHNSDSALIQLYTSQEYNNKFCIKTTENEMISLIIESKDSVNDNSDNRKQSTKYTNWWENNNNGYNKNLFSMYFLKNGKKNMAIIDSSVSKYSDIAISKGKFELNFNEFEYLFAMNSARCHGINDNDNDSQSFLSCDCSNVKGFEFRVSIETKLWLLERLLWIAYLKNESNDNCLLAKLPKDVIKHIISII